MGCDERLWFAECSRAATEISWRVDRVVHDQCVCGGVGVCGWVWIWWVGEHHKLCAPDWHIWALHKVLPVSSTGSTNGLQRYYECSSSSSSPPPSPQPHSPPLICLLLLSIIQSWTKTDEEVCASNYNGHPSKYTPDFSLWIFLSLSATLLFSFYCHC